MDYKEIQEDLKELEERENNIERNDKFIEIFYNWLVDKKLVNKTIKKHIFNIELYLNEFLNYYEVTKMENGVSNINEFFKDWFIRKCMWSSANSIKENATSIKKFYKCMSELNYISQEEYKDLNDEIKEQMEYWLDCIEEYENFF